MNLDGTVNQQDVDPFILALSDPEEYERQYNVPVTYNGDINQDGVLNFDDIDPFRELLPKN